LKSVEKRGDFGCFLPVTWDKIKSAISGAFCLSRVPKLTDATIKLQLMFFLGLAVHALSGAFLIL